LLPAGPGAIRREEVQIVPTYETLFITLPNLSEDEERTVVASLSQVVSDANGTMVAMDRMGRRRLAYPIKKFEDGVYTRFLYDADTSVPRELERRLRISDKVLRQITVRLTEEWAKAAKEQVIRDAEARAEAEAAQAAAAAAGEPFAGDERDIPEDAARAEGDFDEEGEGTEDDTVSDNGR
jgi:small subunit ribosomal protein S6